LPIVEAGIQRRVGTNDAVELGPAARIVLIGLDQRRERVVTGSDRY
jgi:hypothetical protein